MKLERIGLIGYGEVGKIFSNALRAKGVAWVGAWDIKFADALMGGAQRLHAPYGQAELLLLALALRLALAQAALRAGRPVKQLAPELGYANPSALSRLFRQRVGCSVRDWLASEGPAPG